MEKLIFDTGIQEFDVNGTGVLRFNPSDPNIYDRFFRAASDFEHLEQQLTAADMEGLEGQALVEKALERMEEVDRKVKQRLNEVFGPPNDFDQLLEGVNLMAVGANGERVVTNLLAALAPILEDGARKCAEHNADSAVQQAQLNRAARRAMSKNANRKRK